jgi:hypothetical protein
VFSPPLLISDQTTTDLTVTGNDRSIEYYFASDARYENILLLKNFLREKSFETYQCFLYNADLII